MKPIKYVRYDIGYADVILALPDFVEHNSIQVPGTMVSAGFMEFDAFEKAWRCYGESVSLRLKALPEDSRLATKQFPISL
jgi:hypothetical protein